MPASDVPSIHPPQTKEIIRLPLVIPIHPYLKDHHFEGKIIFPAVEILQRLAASLLSYRPDTPVHFMRSLSLDRFLYIEKEQTFIEAIHELEIHEDGRILSRFITEVRIKNAGITRTKIHAAVDFYTDGNRIPPTPTEAFAAIDSANYSIPAQKLYADLVPFGPSFQSLRGDIYISERGGSALVRGGDCPAPSAPLGSTFPLDGAFHVACAWGQRFHHIVAFPVGFEERIVVHPTAPGEICRCRILPVLANQETLKFDIWIHDLAGEVCEYVQGVVMKDVFRGRVRVVEWVMDR
jgi:hypothetical protein